MWETGGQVRPPLRRVCRTLFFPCHSEPVRRLAWESVLRARRRGLASLRPSDAPRERPLPLPLGEVAERSEDGEGKQKRTASGRFFSLSINPLYAASSSFTQGELEGAKPASNQIKCRAKPCLARRAWSEATIFVPQGGTKITTLFQAVERAEGSFDSLKRRPFGRRFKQYVVYSSK